MSERFRQYCKEHKIKMRDVSRMIGVVRRQMPVIVSEEATTAIKKEDVKVYDALRTRLISALDKVVK